MGRSLSPIIQRELMNLDKDADSRKSAMKALKSYVKDLDSKAIPLFLSQVSENKETGSSAEYTIYLFEVLARVHGTKIVPQIDNIMATIVKTLSVSAGSFALHQACSKVVPSIARHGMEPTTPEDKKRSIIQSLCKPLSECLLDGQESPSSGASLCLKALVDCKNWRYASNDLVNEVCQRVVGALEKHMQTNSHMALVMALAKHNSLTIEAYARLLVCTGLEVLNDGGVEGNSQKRLTAIHMLNTMMKCLDSKSIFSEVGLIIEEMEKFQSDPMAYVSGAAYEALQTAKKIRIEKGATFDRGRDSTRDSTFDWREKLRSRNLWGSGDQSPESQSINSFPDSDSFIELPNLGHDQKSVNWKVLPKDENGGLNICPKEGVFPDATHANRSNTEDIDNGGFFASPEYYTNGFSGFFHCTASNGALRSTTSSPQRSRSHINIDDVKIFTTPIKLIHSLQELNNMSSDTLEKQGRGLTSPCPRKLEWSPLTKCEQNGVCDGLNHKVDNNGRLPAGGEELQNSSESVSSTEDVSADASCQVFPKVVPNNVAKPESVYSERSRWKPVRNLVYGIFVILFAVSASYVLINDEEVGYNLVPT